MDLFILRTVAQDSCAADYFGVVPKKSFTYGRMEKCSFHRVMKIFPLPASFFRLFLPEF
jgi:hypothetical protein